MSYFSRFSQNVTLSTNNSSTSNLNAGETFSGIIDSTLSVAGIQIGFYADQNCLVYIEQSPTNSGTPYWDISDSYQYYAGHSFGITVQAISSYFRVRVTNQGSLATTEFRLSSVLCPVVEAIPRSLDEYGNFKVAVQSTIDEYGFGIENTPNGEMRTIVPIRLVGTTMEGTTIDTNFKTFAVANGGTVTQANAQCVLSTNTTSPNGSAIMYSNRRARYISASSMCYRGIVKLSAGATNNKRRWGVAWGETMPTITDGAYFQLDGNTFSIVTLRAGVPTKIDSGSFNGDLGLIYDPGITVKTYEIYWNNSKVWFVVGDTVLHSHTASTETWASTMNHYIYFDNVNSNALQTNHTLTYRTSSIRRLGAMTSLPTSKYQSGTTAGVICKYSAGNLLSIIISNPTNSAVVTIYDGITTGGTVIWSSGALSGSDPTSMELNFHGIPFSNGLFFTITAAACNLLVIYE